MCSFFPTWMVSVPLREALDVLAPDPGLGAHQLERLDELPADAATLAEHLLDGHVAVEAGGIVPEGEEEATALLPESFQHVLVGGY